jgi:hypothetical protein
VMAIVGLIRNVMMGNPSADALKIFEIGVRTNLSPGSTGESLELPLGRCARVSVRETGSERFENLSYPRGLKRPRGASAWRRRFSGSSGAMSGCSRERCAPPG